MSTGISPAETMYQATRALTFVPRGKEGREEYDEAYSDLTDQFKDALYTEYGQGLSRAQHERTYALAYEEGHAAGWYDIQNYYTEYADFARFIIAN